MQLRDGSLRKEMELRDETLRSELQLRDDSLKSAIHSGDTRTQEAVQNLGQKLDFAIEIRERLIAPEARMPRQ